MRQWAQLLSATLNDREWGLGYLMLQRAKGIAHEVRKGTKLRGGWGSSFGGMEAVVRQSGRGWRRRQETWS